MSMSTTKLTMNEVQYCNAHLEVSITNNLPNTNTVRCT